MSSCEELPLCLLEYGDNDDGYGGGGDGGYCDDDDLIENSSCRLNST